MSWRGIMLAWLAAFVVGSAEAQSLTSMSFDLGDSYSVQTKFDAVEQAVTVSLYHSERRVMAVTVDNANVAQEGTEFVRFCGGCDRVLYLPAYDLSSTYGAVTSVVAWQSGSWWSLTILPFNLAHLADDDGDGYAEIVNRIPKQATGGRRYTFDNGLVVPLDDEHGGQTVVGPASRHGLQSLLLEASDDGKTGALPFTGDLQWMDGSEVTGGPSIIARSTIPERGLSVELIFRENTDPDVPANYVFDVRFTTDDTFAGGSIAAVPGLLMKHEELVQGAPLVGVSARVSTNSFLYALSASPDDITANAPLLSRKWMDLALIYATGKRAILTLEKDEEADELFRKLLDPPTANNGARLQPGFSLN